MLCAGVCTLGAADSASAARRGAPADFYGVVTQLNSLSAGEVAKMRRGGVGTVRFLVPWQRVEAAQGSYDWAASDAQIKAIEAAGAVPLPVVYGLPAWLGEPRTPPVGIPEAELAWQRFLGELVDRYGPDGTLAEEDRGYEPIGAWQIWNEPNLSSFWGYATPVAADYVTLLQLSAVAISHADPDAELIAAGLSPASNAVPPPQYLTELYDRYRELGLEPDFDQVSLRAWGERPRLLIAEIGWGSAGPKRHPISGSRAEQAKRLKTAYRLFSRKRRRWRISAVLWYAWRDLPRTIDACVFCSFVGLFDSHGRPKSSWKAFRRLSG
jgi:hypothetical protein